MWISRYFFYHYTIEYASFSLERSRVTFVKDLDSALENRILSARERRTRIFYYATMRKGVLRYLWRFAGSCGCRIDRSTFVCVTGTTLVARRAILVLQTTPICWFVGHCLGTKLVHTRQGGSRERDGKATEEGRKRSETRCAEGCSPFARYRVKFSAECKGPSRELGLRRGLQPSLWIWPCAHTFSKLTSIHQVGRDRIVRDNSLILQPGLASPSAKSEKRT